MREEVRIMKVLSLTPGGNNAWVETSVGRLKKPVNSIPKALLDEFLKTQKGTEHEPEPDVD